MELSERINILRQGAELAQKAGVLSFDEAYFAKSAIDSLSRGENIRTGAEILVKIAEYAQKKGVFTLKDAYFVYLATDGIDALLPPEEETCD